MKIQRLASARSLASDNGNGNGNGNGELEQPFLHPRSLVEAGASLGRGTKVWAFAHVLSGATIGEDCNICDHTFIEGEVSMGNRVTLKCGVFLWDGLVVEDDVFIGPNAVFTNDFRPRSKQHLKSYPRTVLKEGCTLGASSTTLPGLVIGRWAMVGAGSVVTHDVPDYALVVGSPARFRAWICRCGEKLLPASGNLLKCKCGQTYEETTKRKLREFPGNGNHQAQPENLLAPGFIEPNFHHNGSRPSNGQ